MPEKTDKYTFNQELVKFYREKVDDLEEARNILNELKQAKRDGGERHEPYSEEFDQVMNHLLYFAYPKFKKSSQIELPERIESSIDKHVYTVDDLTLEQKQVLLYKIRDLFEAMNITSLEREKWEAEGIGTVDKESDKK